ncbi:MAG: ABC transporter permease [bacterium]|nr:ABC transporter permease [bacterium]
MFKNYLKIALRNLLRHKGYSFINIAGLAIGMACFLLIMLWVRDELSFDKFHANADHIYRVGTSANFGTPMTWAFGPAPAGPAMIENFPEVVSATRFDSPMNGAVEYGEKLFREEGITFADNSFFEIFSFPFIKGDPRTALTTTYSVVINRTTADKYFGIEDPIGKVIKIQGGQYTITGVVENFPKNSHIQFTILRSMETLVKENKAQMEMWFNIQPYTYILLDKNCDVRQLEQKLPNFVNKYVGELLAPSGGKLSLFLQPLTDIHLHSKLDGELSTNGNITYVYLFSAIAVFILLIACVNFINLSTARSAMRAREVGVRKTLGANRHQLIRQFLGEAIIFSLIALILALVLVEIEIPFFNTLVGRQVGMHQDRFTNLATIVGLALLVGILAGSYPALLLSSLRPIKTLKGSFVPGASRSHSRSALVIFQFIISIALIAGTITIYSQLHYMKNKDVGFNKEHVIILPELTPRMRESVETIKAELKAIPDVQQVAAVSFVPGKGMRLAIVQPEGYADDQPVTVSILDIDDDFLSTMGMQLVEGRNFSQDLPTDKTGSILINETTARKLGWDHPIGKNITSPILTDSGGVALERKVIGVVRDFHQASLHRKIEPIIIGQNASEFRALALRIAPQNISQTLASIKRTWKSIDPNRPFNSYFLDEAFDARYKAEERMGMITLIFSSLAIFIACLGLFGMSAFTAEQRTKEIGIRKVFGASVAGIIGLLTRKFMILVLLANVIAWPIAYYSLNRWLQNFAYRIDLNLGHFLLAGLLALLVSLITVSFQAIKVARSNPAKALRYE